MIAGKSVMVWCGKHLHELTDQQLLETDQSVRMCRDAVAHELGDIPAMDGYAEDLAELEAHLADRGLTRLPLPEINPFMGKVHAVETS